MRTEEQTLKFEVEWPNDLAAGIYGGSEDVTVTLQNGGWPPETLDALRIGMRDLLAEVFDGRCLTEEEVKASDARLAAQEEGDHA